MEKLWDKVEVLYRGNPEGWWLLGAVIIVAWLTCVPWRRNMEWVLSNPKGRGKMLRKKRREFVEQQAIDDFVHIVEERWFHGVYSDEEKKELYRRFRLAFPTVRDLFPSPELLKEAIKRRKEKDLLVKVKLPDAVSELDPKPRHMFHSSFRKSVTA